MTTAVFTGPRPVYCPTLHLYRHLDTARQVCAGRFTHAGRTLDLGLEPDWRRTDVCDDREFWIEWSKFYFGLDLAHAFAGSGEARFQQAWTRLVASWIEQVPAGFGPTDAIGRRLQNWIYAWTQFAAAPGFQGLPAGFEDTLLASIAAQTAYLETHLTAERNHRTLELYALFVVALALPALDPDRRRLQFAWEQLHENLLSDFRTDGVHREHSTHYHMVALRSFLAARENARRFGVPVARAYDQRLSRAVDFAMFCQRPDGSIPALSDSDSADYRESLVLAADLLEREDVRFVATNGARGEAPLPATASFDAAGYYVQRSSWSELPGGVEPHRHLIFDCGGIGDGGHGHYDLLNIDVWAGRPLIVDPGRYTYAQGTPDWRHAFKGTAAHNTVTVDGRDQTRYFPGKPRAGAATGRLVTRLQSPGLEVIGAEARSLEYDAVHTRHVFFVHQQYWIVVDELTAPSAHDYDLRFHLAAEAWAHTSARDQRVEAPGVTLLFDAPAPPRLEDGWVSTTYGIKHQAPVVSVRAGAVDCLRFVTAILPAEVSSAGSTLSAVAQGHELMLTVSGVGAAGHLTDTVLWRSPDASAPQAFVTRSSQEIR